MHLVISEAERACPCLSVPIFGAEGTDAGFAFGTETRLRADGFSIGEEGRVEVAEGHHDFVSGVAGGR